MAGPNSATQVALVLKLAMSGGAPPPTVTCLLVLAVQKPRAQSPCLPISSLTVKGPDAANVCVTVLPLLRAPPKSHV
jgi:hypothetical protein